MLGWSINLFRIRGIQLALHFSFLLLLAYVANEGWQDSGLPGLLWSVAILLAFFACVVLHELGHSFTAMHYGVGVRRILLMPIGGMAEMDTIPRQPSQELLITIAGPAVNFGIVLILTLAFGLPRGLPFHPQFEDSFTGLAQLLLYWNGVMGCFNLLPVFPMDGGRILRALLAIRLPYLRATYWAATIGKILAVLAALTAALVFQHYLTAVLFGFIYFAGEAEYRAVRRREMEDAHWRAALARIYGRVPVTEEPPLL